LQLKLLRGAGDGGGPFIADRVHLDIAGQAAFKFSLPLSIHRL
jgi:hypothetical protein